MKIIENRDLLRALVQNYGFKFSKVEKLPTVDYVYPDYTADGNTESFRFSSSLRRELRERSKIVTNDLHSKKYIAWTHARPILEEVASIAPRLGINEQLTGQVNSIYHSPVLFIGANKNDIFVSAYLVKPVVDMSVAWFDFTNEERTTIHSYLRHKAEEKPYRNLFERIFVGDYKFWPTLPMG